jgi:hypothetical protein
VAGKYLQERPVSISAGLGFTQQRLRSRNRDSKRICVSPARRSRLDLTCSEIAVQLGRLLLATKKASLSARSARFVSPCTFIVSCAQRYHWAQHCSYAKQARAKKPLRFRLLRAESTSRTPLLVINTVVEEIGFPLSLQIARYCQLAVSSFHALSPTVVPHVPNLRGTNSGMLRHRPATPTPRTLQSSEERP